MKCVTIKPILQGKQLRQTEVTWLVKDGFPTSSQLHLPPWGRGRAVFLRGSSLQPLGPHPWRAQDGPPAAALERAHLPASGHLLLAPVPVQTRKEVKSVLQRAMVKGRGPWGDTHQPSSRHGELPTYSGESRTHTGCSSAAREPILPCCMERCSLRRDLLAGFNQLLNCAANEARVRAWVGD